MANPTLLTSPIAENGDKNVIPASTGATTGLLDQEHGFQQINELPLQAGGLPPQRKDFNGIFNLLSGIDYMTQRGYTFEWDATLPYVVGCIVRDTDGKLYRCINDVAAGGSNPSADATNWELYEFLSVNGGNVLGSDTSYTMNNDSGILRLIVNGASGENSINIYGQDTGVGGGIYTMAKSSDNRQNLIKQTYNELLADVTNIGGTTITYDILNASILGKSILANNGYIVYKSGLRIEWGYGKIGEGSYTPFTFPLSFSALGGVFGSTSGGHPAYLAYISDTSFSARSDASNVIFYWFAIGV